jgi:hypothetical protein
MFSRRNITMCGIIVFLSIQNFSPNDIGHYLYLLLIIWQVNSQISFDRSQKAKVLSGLFLIEDVEK